jgi:hypothetical protein
VETERARPRRRQGDPARPIDPVKLEDLVAAAPGLGSMSHGIRICFFGWWLHRHGGKEYFQAADVGKCYDTLHLVRPSSFGGYFKNLVGCNDLLKSAAGYRLTHAQREKHEKKYGQNPTTTQITAMLAGLPAQMTTLAERTYLDEALICYRNGAVRAAIVMTWNLAYAHLCDHIVKNKLAEFNAQWLTAYSGDHKKGQRTIKTVDDFAGEELNENKVLKIAMDCGAIVKNVYNVLEPALKRRNAAAHPNNVVLTPLQTEAFIEDLVNNAILKIV